VQEEEPKAISFFISSGIAAPNIFATYERFVDRAAMEAHNNSEVVKNTSDCWADPRRPDCAGDR
jgi:quinol monooxygenase YgiN